MLALRMEDPQYGYDSHVKAAVITGSGIEFRMPLVLFDLPASLLQARNAYFPSRDGQRFLVNKQVEAPALADQCGAQQTGLKD